MKLGVPMNNWKNKIIKNPWFSKVWMGVNLTYWTWYFYYLFDYKLNMMVKM